MRGRVVFSGRMDRPHVGHLATIQRLGEIFDKVIVILLNYPTQKYPIAYRRNIIESLLRRCDGEYAVAVNDANFETISPEEATKYVGADEIYASGNEKCVKHMHELGYDVLWTQRSWDYEAHLEG